MVGKKKPIDNKSEAEEELALTQADEASLLPALAGEDDGQGSSDELVKYDPLQRYLAEIRRHATLSREEERELALRYKEQGDQMAGYQLVLANLRLVVMIAREYQRTSQNMLDLIQEGNMGLLEAVKQFDPYRGVRFPSYAVYWIRAYMLRYLISNLRLVKIGTTQAQRKLFYNLHKEKQKLESEGFIPEAKLLAERLNVKESEVIEMEQRLALPDLSVDAPVRADDENLDLHGVLADESQDVEGMVANDQLQSLVREAVAEFKKTLDAKEIAIIDRRLFTDDPETLQAIAKEFDLSRERIRQIESRLKARLKEFLAGRLKLEEDEVLIGGGS